MKKLAVLVGFIIALVSGSLSPACAGEKIVIGISTPTADHGWTGGIVWWAEQAVKQIGKKHPEIEFILRPSATEREQAAAESGRKDVKLFLGGGGSKAIIKHVLASDSPVPVTVTYPPKMIFEGVWIAVEHLLTGKNFPQEIVIPSELVTKDNAVAFYYPDSIY